MKYSAALFCTLVAVALAVRAEAAEPPTLDASVGTFEQSSVPTAWVNSGQDLSISERHFKDGAHSLRWHWVTGQKLTVRRPDGLSAAAQNKNGSLYIWIYNEEPTNGHLTFKLSTEVELSADQPAPYEFQFGLDYRGWRAAWVNFGQDMVNPAFAGKRIAPADAMQIIAPSNAGTSHGTVFFDDVEFVVQNDWLRTPDAQVPFVNAERAGPGVSEDIKDEDVDLNAYQFSQIRPIPAPAIITDEQRQAFKLISERYDQWMYGKDVDPKTDDVIRICYDAREKYIRAGKAAFEKLNIRRQDGAITGTPLFALLDSRHKPSFTNVFEEVMLPLAWDWKLHHNEQSKQHFLDVINYVHDQGWAAGSANATLDHQTLRISGYMHSVYLMRDELRAAGLLDRELSTMRWYAYFNNAYRADLPAGASADQIRNDMMHRLLIVLAMDDSPAKVRDMQALLHWENQAVAVAPGWADTIKPDFTGYHHRGIYGNVYAPDAFHMAALCCYLQHGTPFEMSPQSAENIRSALLSSRVMTNKYVAPMAISGRMPFGFGTSDRISPGFAYMALAADTPDHQMAAAFKRLWSPSDPDYRQSVISPISAGIFFAHGLGALQLMEQVADLPVKAEPAPTGNWIKPYGGLMVHRRDNWMLSVKAWSKYVWSFEDSATENVFGRNLSFGTLQLLCGNDPVTREGSGWTEAGWDWAHIPGTTTVDLPLEQLGKSKKMRTFSDQTFVGGASLQGSNGVFAMRLHDTAYDPSFFASKSVFCFDNRIVCLGGDIVNNDPRSTQTTLFQTHLSSADTPTCLGGESAVSGIGLSKTFSNDQRVWLTDSVGNGYLIPRSNGLHVQRQSQTSIDNSGKRTTHGDFVKAWIDHGPSPRNAGYEYAILVQGGSPHEMAAFAAKPMYRVLRRDSAVHAVSDLTSDTTGCAIFDASGSLDLGPLKKASIPCITMFKQSGDQMALAVASPDIGLLAPNEQQPADIESGISDRQLLRRSSPRTTVRLTLAGNWSTVQSDKARVIEAISGDTIIEVDCKDGLTTEVDLSQKYARR